MVDSFGRSADAQIAVSAVTWAAAKADVLISDTMKSSLSKFRMIPLLRIDGSPAILGS
jgi:hypothetical protein